MGLGQDGRRLSAPTQRLRDRWIAWVLAHHRGILGLAAIVTVVAGLLASQLKIESDLRALLPPEHPVIVSLEGIEDSFIRLGSINVVAQGGTADERHAFADAVAEKLEELPQISDVEYRLRSDFFADHALYYLSDEEMDSLDEHVQAWTHYEACSREPDLCLDDPDPEAPKRLRELVRDKQGQALERAGFADYYEREGIDALVILAHPTRDSSDLDFSLEVTAATRAVIDEVGARTDAPWVGSSMSWNVVGPYAVKADENQAIRRDMVVSGTFALFGVITILLLLFRSFRAVYTLLIPLLCGVTWSMGVTWILLGHLNTMTSLISTVVMGMGIDAGIHFLHGVRRERQDHGEHEAISRAFRNLIVPLLIASATTLGAFVVMASSSFPAFKEFGLIAVLGVLLCLLSMVTVFPALLLLVGVRLPKPEKETGFRAGLVRGLLRRPGLVFLGLLLVSGAAYLGASRVAFENNGRMLQSESRRDSVAASTAVISSIFGKDIHAGILVVDSLDRAREILTRARADLAKRKAEGTSVVAELFAGVDILPPPEIDPEARKEAIDILVEDVPESTWEKLEAQAGEGEAGKGESHKGGESGGADEAGEAGEAGEAPEAPEGGKAVGDDAGDEAGEDSDAGDEADKEKSAEEGDAAGVDGEADKEKSSEAGEAGDGAEGDEAAEEKSAEEGDAGSEDGDADKEKSGEVGGEDGDAGDAAEEKSAETGKDGKDGEGDRGDSEGLSAEDARRLRAMLKADPVRLEEVPPTILAKIRSDDGRYAIYAYPDFDVADIQKGVEYMDETAAYVGDGDERFVGETTVYAAMYLMMRDEAPTIIATAAGVIVLLVLLQLRSLFLVVVTLLPLVISVWWLLGLMGAFDIRFTLFNIPILPAVLGIGVDNGVYLTDRIRRLMGDDPEGGLRRALRETGGAILAATTTTALGFATFIVADSGGLKGIGIVAVLGILCAAAAALLTIPCLFALAGRLRKR